MLKDNNIAELLQFLSLDYEARELLQDIKADMQVEIPAILERFYERIESWPQVNSLFESDVSKARARQRQAAHWGTLLSAKFDDEFIQAVKRVGKTHYRIGLGRQWYIGSYAYIISEILAKVCRKFSHGVSTEQADRRDKAMAAVLRAALIDMELAISVYLEEGDEAVKKEMDERRLAEMKLTEKASELEIALSELEAFTYSVSHDLRAPLRSIDGFSHALEDDYADKLDETGKDLLLRVRQATTKMGQLIDDLLKLSRLNRATLLPERVNLSTMVEEIVQTLKEGDPDRTVEVKIEPELNEECDPRLINVALTNLLDNAWKYTRMESQARIEFGKTYQDGRAAYFVRDNGIGFDMTYADKLFKPFQRLHSVNAFPGTGIGLATVARIIHRHGGRIEAQSEPEKGSTFTFEISNRGN